MKVQLDNKFLWAIILAGSLSACVSEGNNTGIEYAPNMYVSEAYEAYTQSEDDEYEFNQYGMTMRLPVEGTVARGQLSYLGYPEGYEASASWLNPMPAYESQMNGRIKENYLRNCSHCHGNSGKNDGGVIKTGQYPPPPWDGYSSAAVQDLSDGQIFHTITHGKGNMGSHASVLTPNERWELVNYVRFLGKGDAFQFDNEPAEGSPTPGAMNGMAGHDGSDLASIDAKGLGSIDGMKLMDLDEVERNMLVQSMRSINFKFLSKNIKEESHVAIDRVVNYMNEHADYNAILGGHAAGDSDGAVKGELGLKRAQEVRAYMVSKGVAESRLKVKSMGSSDPIASNDTKEGREQNRRVEIYITE